MKELVSNESEEKLRTELTDEEREQIEKEIKELVLEYNKDFKKAPEYEMLGIAYFFSSDARLIDNYVPLGENVAFNPYYTYSRNHGVSISNHLYGGYADARAVVEVAKKNIVESSKLRYEEFGFTDLVFSEGEVFADMDTVGFAYLKVQGIKNSKEYTFLHIMYADIRSNGNYYYTNITLESDEFDEYTQKLMEEINDCYALRLPTTLEALIK